MQTGNLHALHRLKIIGFLLLVSHHISIFFIIGLPALPSENILRGNAVPRLSKISESSKSTAVSDVRRLPSATIGVTLRDEGEHSEDFSPQRFDSDERVETGTHSMAAWDKNRIYKEPDEERISNANRRSCMSGMKNWFNNWGTALTEKWHITCSLGMPSCKSRVCPSLASDVIEDGLNSANDVLDSRATEACAKLKKIEPHITQPHTVNEQKFEFSPFQFDSEEETELIPPYFFTVGEMIEYRNHRDKIGDALVGWTGRMRRIDGKRFSLRGLLELLDRELTPPLTEDSSGHKNLLTYHQTHKNYLVNLKRYRKAVQTVEDAYTLWATAQPLYNHELEKLEKSTSKRKILSRKDAPFPQNIKPEGLRGISGKFQVFGKNFENIVASLVTNSETLRTSGDFDRKYIPRFGTAAFTHPSNDEPQQGRKPHRRISEDNNLALDLAKADDILFAFYLHPWERGDARWEELNESPEEVIFSINTICMNRAKIEEAIGAKIRLANELKKLEDQMGPQLWHIDEIFSSLLPVERCRKLRKKKLLTPELLNQLSGKAAAKGENRDLNEAKKNNS